MNLDLTAIPGEIARRTLGREAWARDRLAAHAGRTFSVTVGPAIAGFRIAPDGTLESTSLAGITPDLELTLSPFALPAFLADPRDWNGHVVECRDAALAGTLKELAQTLPWFVEQTFARMLGPVAGLRVADAGRRLLAFPGYAAERVGASVVRYARDEAALVVGHDEMRPFADAAAALAARVDALELRVAALSERAP